MLEGEEMFVHVFATFQRFVCNFFKSYMYNNMSRGESFSRERQLPEYREKQWRALQHESVSSSRCFVFVLLAVC